MLKTIPISDLIPPKRRLRALRKYDVVYCEMVESMKKDGVLQPILVRPLGDKYEVVEGNYRHSAATEAGLVEIPCLVREMTDHEVLILQLKANAIRPLTNKYEYARRIYKLLKDDSLTVDSLCQGNPARGVARAVP
jgi:ParB family chromosome partitioning protein